VNSPSDLIRGNQKKAPRTEETCPRPSRRPERPRQEDERAHALGPLEGHGGGVERSHGMAQDHTGPSQPRASGTAQGAPAAVVRGGYSPALV
jgi:hypothetical protein